MYFYVMFFYAQINSEKGIKNYEKVLTFRKRNGII